MKFSYKLFAVVILFLSTIYLSYLTSAEISIESPDGSASTNGVMNIRTPDPPPVNNNTIGNVTGADFWDDLDTPADILHNLLANLEWSVAGHIMDSVLDMNSNNIEEVENITVENKIFLEDQDHWIKQGASDIFQGDIAEDTVWFHHNEVQPGGTIAFLFSAVAGDGINKTMIAMQVGRNNSAGILGNSWMVLPNNLTNNLTVFSDCFFIADQLGETLRVACDTSDTGADLIVQDDIQAFGTVFADEGIRAETLVDFIMNGEDVNIQNGSLHIITPITFQAGVTKGDEVSTFDEFFLAGLGAFTNLQSDLGNWFTTSSVFCSDGDCAEAIGISEVGNIIMEANISTLNINETSLNFIYSLVSIKGTDSFIVTANNNEGSGHVSLLTDSTDNVAKSIQSIPMPSTMWNQSNVGIRFECDATKSNRECFVDTVDVNGTAMESTLTNQSGFNSVIKFSDGALAPDGFPERGIFYVAENDTIVIRGTVIEETVIEQTVNITNLLILDNEGITNWDNVSLFDDNVLLVDGSRSLTDDWNVAGNITGVSNFQTNTMNTTGNAFIEGVLRLDTVSSFSGAVTMTTNLDIVPGANFRLGVDGEDNDGKLTLYSQTSGKQVVWQPEDLSFEIWDDTFLTLGQNDFKMYYNAANDTVYFDGAGLIGTANTPTVWTKNVTFLNPVFFNSPVQMDENLTVLDRIFTKDLNATLGIFTTLNVTKNATFHNYTFMTQINPNGGNLDLFGVEDLGGSTDGYKLIIHNEGEGASNTGEIFVDRFGRFTLNSPNDIVLLTGGGDGVQFESITVSDTEFRTGNFQIIMKPNSADNGVMQTDQGNFEINLNDVTKIRFRHGGTANGFNEVDFDTLDIITTGALNVTNNVTIGSVGNPGCISIRDSDNGGWSKIRMLNGGFINSTGKC